MKMRSSAKGRYLMDSWASRVENTERRRWAGGKGICGELRMGDWGLLASLIIWFTGW